MIVEQDKVINACESVMTRIVVTDDLDVLLCLETVMSRRFSLRA